MPNRPGNWNAMNPRELPWPERVLIIKDIPAENCERTSHLKADRGDSVGEWINGAASDVALGGSNFQAMPTEPGIYKELLDHVSDGVYVVDRERRFLYCNDAAFRLTGYKADEIVGQFCRDHKHCPIGRVGLDLCRRGCLLSACINDGGSREVNAFIRNKRGRRVPVSFRVQPVRAADGSIVGAVEIFKDDSARRADRRKAEEMQRLAFLDSLTQAPNRRFLQMSLQTAMREYQVTKDRFGVLLIDLDSFKAINDSFGHARGDRVLQRAAKAFVGALRPTDAVGRWGGDEFLAIVRNVSIETLNDLAKRCVAMVGQISISGNGSRPTHLSISVGGTLNRPNDTPRSLVRRADGFLYESKTSGRGCATTG